MRYTPSEDISLMQVLNKQTKFNYGHYAEVLKSYSKFTVKLVTCYHKAHVEWVSDYFLQVLLVVRGWHFKIGCAWQ